MARDLRQYVLVRCANGELVAFDGDEWLLTNDFLKANHFENDFMATRFICENPQYNLELVHARIKFSNPQPLNTRAKRFYEHRKKYNQGTGT